MITLTLKLKMKKSIHLARLYQVPTLADSKGFSSPNPLSIEKFK